MELKILFVVFFVGSVLHNHETATLRIKMKLKKDFLQVQKYTGTTPLLRQIHKRSVNLSSVQDHYQRNRCLRTLTQFVKNECENVVSAHTEGLNLTTWRQDYTSHETCVGLNGYSRFINVVEPARTVVLVYNQRENKWKKIISTVGFYCSRAITS